MITFETEIQKLSLAAAPVSDCNHYWDYPKPFAEEIGQTVVKEIVQDNIIKKYVKFHGSVKQQSLI